MTERERLLLRRLRQIQLSDKVTVKDLEELAVPTAGLESATRLPIITPDAIESWRRFEQDEALNHQDLFNLEGIILGNGLRPAFDIENDSYGMLPSKWKDLNDQRPLIEPLIRGIGRLDLIGHPKLTYAGTAFLCGERRLITNRHVAQIFTEGIGSAQLSFTSGITPSIDLKQEVGSTISLEAKIIAPILVLEEWDIAVLEVDSVPSNVRPLPMMASVPSDIEDRTAAIVGYPTFDPRDDMVQQITIFRGVFDKKRLQPGLLKGMGPAESFGKTVQALAHDCTTIGGNSGSAVIEVATARIAGVHFTSNAPIANYAVPTWALANEPRVRQAGVEFVG
jgi:endonuclease G, mitochondrial